MRRLFVLLAALALPAAVTAQTRVSICHDYGCKAETEIVYSAAQLLEIDRLLASAFDPRSERSRLAEAVGMLYRWAGEQSPISRDRGGNFADEDEPGRMDCIDHSTSTTRLLQMLAARNGLRWHRVLEVEPRYFLGFVANHWSAVIEERWGGRFVVDSWFVNNGEPAVILPLEEWKKGAGPDV